MAKCDLNHSRCFRIVLRTLWFDSKNGTPVTFLVIYSDCWTGSSRPCGTFEWVTMQHLLLLEWFILAVANLFMNCHLCLVACFASLTIFSAQACVLPRWIISFPDGRVTCPTFTLGAKYRYVGVQEVHHFNIKTKTIEARSQYHFRYGSMFNPVKVATIKPAVVFTTSTIGLFHGNGRNMCV